MNDEQTRFAFPRQVRRNLSSLKRAALILSRRPMSAEMVSSFLLQV